jgi:ABC-type spermidine/putrescine transport system permease subunit I
MSVQALQPTTSARPGGLLARAWAVPTLLLAPCLIWIFAFFLLPLGLMCWRSLATEGFSLAPYATLFTSPLYVKVLLTTLKMASIATVCALLLAYPIAYRLTMTSGKVRGAILLFILIPYWVDIIVRSFSWLIMLGDNGLINKALIGLGLVSDPLALLYNSFSVLVAMTQILLPITIVTLFGAMLRIDRTLMAAATIHGADDWQVFRTVFFPLSLPGVYGAGLLAFILALGFYVTPALLGSPKETMIAQTIMVDASQLLDWAQASAAGAVLLMITTAIAAVYNRYFSLDRLWGGSEP